MASTKIQQRRNRTIIIMSLLAVSVIGYFAWQIIHPTLPGYASHPPVGKYAPLDWKLLLSGTWPAGKAPNAPQEIKALAGQMVTVRGYTLPMHNSKESSELFIAPKPSGCYFCTPPGVSEIVQIEVAGGNKVPLTEYPVHAYGKLKVATGVEGDTSLYMIEDAILTVGK